MLKILKILKIFLIICVITTSISAKEAGDKVRLQLKWFTSFQFAGYHMALEKGFYEDVGLNVEILQRDPSKNNIKQVLEGEAEYGVADSTILLYRANNKPVKILASIFQHSPLILIAKKSSNILSPYEMKGKIISFERDLDDAPIVAMLEFTGIREEDYIYKKLDLNYKEFIAGEVDVISSYISDQPYYFRKLGIEINIISPLSYGVDFYGDNLFTTQSEIDKHPLRVKNFTEASLKGWKYALENKEETIQVLIDKYGAKRSLEHLRFEAFNTQKMILADVVDIGYTSIERFRRIGDIYKNIGKISEEEKELALNALIYNPNNTENSNIYYLYLFFTLLGISIVVSTAFYLFNRHLKATVKMRTKELIEQQETVDKYVIMVETDKEGVITYVSSAFCFISGFDESELLNAKNSIVKHPDTPLSVYKSLWGAITHGKSWKGEIKNRRKDGSNYWLALNIDNVYDSDGITIGYRSIMQDVSDRKIAEELSITDALTKIYNRLYLDRILEIELQRSQRYQLALSIVLVDIDNFKMLNDVHGHQVGDIVLQEISAILQNNIRKSDTLGRWGGEEFLLVLSNTDKEAASILAEKIRHSIESHEFSVVHTQTGSFGVSSCQKDDTSDTLINRADKALYKAKASGKNIVMSQD